MSTVRGTGFGALGANAFRPLGRDLGMPKGSRGGTWAIRPSAGMLKLLARRWLDCFGAVPAGRQFILSAVQRMVCQIVVAQTTGEALGFRSRSMCSMREPPDSYRPLYLQGLPNFLKPLPVKPSPR